MRGLRTITTILLLFGIRCAPAQAPSEPGLRATGELLSEHLHRGLERADETAHLGIAWRGESARVAWDAFAPIRSDAPAEWRVEGGWAVAPAANISLEALARWSHFTRAQAGMAEDTLEAGLAATWTLPRELKLGAAVFQDVTVEATTVEGSALYSVPLTKLGAYLDFRAYLGWVEGRDWRPRSPGNKIADSYGYYGAEVSLPYRIGELTSVVVGAAYSEAWNAREAGHFPHRGGQRNLIWRIGVTFEF